MVQEIVGVVVRSGQQPLESAEGHTCLEEGAGQVHSVLVLGRRAGAG